VIWRLLRWLEYRLWGDPVDPAWTPQRLIQKYAGADTRRHRRIRRRR